MNALTSAAASAPITPAWHDRIFNGDWVPGGGGTVQVVEPATGALLHAVGKADLADVAAAVAQASQAQRAWAATAPRERAAVRVNVRLDNVAGVKLPVFQLVREEGGAAAAVGDVETLGLAGGGRQIGTAKDKAGVISFVLNGYKTEDVGAALNREGVAVRSGHHCAQPILRRFGVETTVRPSLALYNTCADIDTLISALLRLTSRKHF